MPGPMGGGGHHNRGAMPQENRKEKVDIKALKKLFYFARAYWPVIILSIICAIIGAVATIVGPDKVSELINLITAGIFTEIDMPAVVHICILLIIIYSVGALFNYIQQYVMAIVTQRISKNLRSSLNQKMNKLPLNYYDKNTTGDVLSRVTNDVDTIAQTLGVSVANLISSIVLFVGVTFMMFRANWLLALVTIGCAFIGFAINALLLSKSQKFFYKRQNLLGQLNGQIEEVYTNYKVVRSYNAINNEQQVFAKTNGNLYSADWKSQFISGMMTPIMMFVGNLSTIMIFVVGVAIILGGGDIVTIGTLISFMIYSRLFSQPLSTFAQSMTSFQQSSAASRRVFEVLDEPEMQDESQKIKKLENVKGEVEFKDVNFAYIKNKPIIQNLSIKLKAGQKVAIVGPTGAGKTTIVNLLMRFYELDSGTITVDGVDIFDMKRQDVHDLFDMILQDAWLFNGTLRENLVYNKKGVTDEELDKVIKAVGLSHYVNALPNKYDTIIDGSQSLSEGQKQQITIARAMIKNSPLLILDEATSNVDTRTELVIQEAMDNLTKGRTSFVIAHRLSTIKNADLILVVQNGRIVEQGTHKELLKAGKFYAELYNSQFSEEEL